MPQISCRRLQRRTVGHRTSRLGLQPRTRETACALPAQCTKCSASSYQHKSRLQPPVLLEMPAAQEWVNTQPAGLQGVGGPCGGQLAAHYAVWQRAAYHPAPPLLTAPRGHPFTLYCSACLAAPAAAPPAGPLQSPPPPGCHKWAAARGGGIVSPAGSCPATSRLLPDCQRSHTAVDCTQG